MNRSCRVARANDDEGAVLVIALVFLIAMGLLISGLLDYSLTSFSTSNALQDQRGQVYAAEGALYSAVQSVRGTANLGAENQSCPDIPTAVSINGYPTRVHCSPQAGSGSTATNRPQFALLALPASGSTVEGVSDAPTNGSGGGTSDVYVGSKIASNGFIDEAGNGASGKFYINGSAVARGACMGQVVSTPACTTTSTNFTDPGYTLPSGGAPGTPAAAQCLTNAVEFFPGTYSSAPTAPGGCNKPWWFSPGNYYFDFTSAGSHAWDLTGRTVVGGTANPKNFSPTSGSAAPTMPGSCKTEVDLPPNQGVEWVFGGDTTLTTGTGSLELCANPATSTQQIAIFGVGGSGAPGASSITATSNPTVAVGPLFSNTGNALAIDGATANDTITKKTSSVLTTSSFSAISLPAGAAVQSATLTIAHMEDASTNFASLSALVTSGTYSQSMTSSCATNQLCLSNGSIRTDTLDVTSAFTAHPTTFATALSVAFTGNASNGHDGIESFDGAQLSVTYVPVGGYRAQSGCVTIALPAVGGCDFLSNASGGQMYIQGTVYAPLARVDVVTATADTVQLNRGVVARDIIAEIHPGNGSSHAFSLGDADRLVLMTVDVQVNGTWVPRLRSLVAIIDGASSGSFTPGVSVNYLSWEDLR